MSSLAQFKKSPTYQNFLNFVKEGSKSYTRLPHDSIIEKYFTDKVIKVFHQINTTPDDELTALNDFKKNDEDVLEKTIRCFFLL